MGNKELREIIHIDEDLCDGCGQCVPACAERAIAIVNGKARLISEVFCDGLGACLGDCPQGAISIEMREAAAFDEEAVEEHIRSQEEVNCSCPSISSIQGEEDLDSKEGSSLANWPIQLGLVSPSAFLFKASQLFIVADCVPLAFRDFHNRFLKGKPLLIGCPKLDDTSAYVQKLQAIFKNPSLEKVMLLMMEVPCCSGLSHLVSKAIKESGRDIQKEDIVITIKGEVLS